MKLVTGSNASYFPRMHGLFESVRQHGNGIDATYVAVGWPGADVGGWNTVAISREDNYGAPPQTECIQHGSFIDVLGADGDEVVLYCDGDMTMQRPIDPDEYKLLVLDYGDVVVGYNGGEHETLITEAHRLGPRVPMASIEEEWGSTPCYNVGCVAMTANTWRFINGAYLHYWDHIGTVFQHQARQQWLLSWLFHSLSLNVKIMPWSFHAHGHHGPKPGMARQNGYITIDGRVALFRHFC